MNHFFKKIALLLSLALLAAVGAKAGQPYEISKATSTGDWTFNGGFSISTTKIYSQSLGVGTAIKYSRNTQYTINIPSGIDIHTVVISGYCNNDGGDAYISELGGKTYGVTEYVFPKKVDGNNVFKSNTITLDTPATGTLTFTAKGQQVGWVITLYDYEIYLGRLTKQ